MYSCEVAVNRTPLPGTGSKPVPLPATSSKPGFLPATGLKLVPLPATDSKPVPLPDTGSKPVPLPATGLKPVPRSFVPGKLDFWFPFMSALSLVAVVDSFGRRYPSKLIMFFFKLNHQIYAENLSQNFSKYIINMCIKVVIQTKMGWNKTILVVGWRYQLKLFFLQIKLSNRCSQKFFNKSFRFNIHIKYMYVYHSI